MSLCEILSFQDFLEFPPLHYSFHIFIMISVKYIFKNTIVHNVNYQLKLMTAATYVAWTSVFPVILALDTEENESSCIFLTFHWEGLWFHVRRNTHTGNGIYFFKKLKILSDCSWTPALMFLCIQTIYLRRHILLWISVKIKIVSQRFIHSPASWHVCVNIISIEV